MAFRPICAGRDRLQSRRSDPMTLFHLHEGPSAPPPASIQPPWWDRFFMCVWSPGRNPDACWIWTGPYDGCGYGMFSFGRIKTSTGRKSAERAHRFLISHFLQWEIPESLVVLHACDNPPCVNPLHLSIGTIDCNMADRNRKGRQARGSRSAKAILTESDVLAIRESTETPNEVALRYGVSAPLIYNIRARRNWTHI